MAKQVHSATYLLLVLSVLRSITDYMYYQPAFCLTGLISDLAIISILSSYSPCEYRTLNLYLSFAQSPLFTQLSPSTSKSHLGFESQDYTCVLGSSPEICYLI